LDIHKLRNLSELVRNGEASSIFPVKSGGLKEVANLAASLAGGRAYLIGDRKGCPATAVILTSEK